MVSSGSAPGCDKTERHSSPGAFQLYLEMFIVSVCVCTFQLLTKHGEEDGEVDRTGRLFEHLVDLFLFHVEATYGSQGRLTFIFLFLRPRPCVDRTSTYQEQRKCPSDRSCQWSRLCSGPWWWRPRVSAQDSKDEWVSLPCSRSFMLTDIYRLNSLVPEPLSRFIKKKKTQNKTE